MLTQTSRNGRQQHFLHLTKHVVFDITMKLLLLSKTG